MDVEERAALEKELALQIKQLIINEDDDDFDSTEIEERVGLNSMDVDLVIQNRESESDTLKSDSIELINFIIYAKNYGDDYCDKVCQELASLNDCEDHTKDVSDVFAEESDRKDCQLQSSALTDFPHLCLEPLIVLSTPTKTSSFDLYDAAAQLYGSAIDEYIEEERLEECPSAISSEQAASCCSILQNPFSITDAFEEVFKLKYDILEDIIVDELVERECMYALQKQEDENSTMIIEDCFGHLCRNSERECMEGIAMTDEDVESKIRESKRRDKANSTRESNLMASEEKYERQRLADQLRAEAFERRRIQEMRDFIARQKIQWKVVLTELEERHRHQVHRQTVCQLEMDRSLRENIAMEREELFNIQSERFLRAERECMSWEDIASFKERVLMRKRCTLYQLQQNQLRCNLLSQLKECLRIRSEIHNMRHQDQISLLQKQFISDVLRARGRRVYTLYVVLSSKRLFRSTWKFWVTEMRQSRKAFVAANRMQTAFRGYNVRRKYQNALRTALFVTTLENDGDVYTAIDFDTWMESISTHKEEERVVPKMVFVTQKKDLEVDEINTYAIPQEIVNGEGNMSFKDMALEGNSQDSVNEENGSLSLWNQWKSRHGRRKHRTQKKTSDNVNHKSQVASLNPVIKWSTTQKIAKPKSKVVSLVERLRNTTAGARHK